VVTIPLAPRTARAIDLAIGERMEGPIFLTADGRRLDRHGAGRIVRRAARRAGITKPVGPHTPAARVHHRRRGRRRAAAPMYTSAWAGLRPDGPAPRTPTVTPNPRKDRRSGRLKIFNR
jgi:integrase